MSIYTLSDNYSPREFRVKELSLLVKNTVEDNFKSIKVKGEVSGLKIASSGHAYFNLKEDDAILFCTCWKHSFSKINFKLEDGVEIIAYGNLTTYMGTSKYQLSVEKIEAAGIGALMKLLQERKEKFKAEGLFDQVHKKNIPFIPNIIGIITSETGSVIKDMIHRIEDRFPSRIILWPVAVQGENASSEIANALYGFNKLKDEIKPDVIIVARGGGSIEDLWAFNEEIVVRAVFASQIPVISAVGHETDVTLIDFVADKRAPTPTAAAEFVVPVINDLKILINNLGLRLDQNIFSLVKHKILELKILQSKLKESGKFLYVLYQKFDQISIMLSTSLPNNLELKKSKLLSIKLPYIAIENLVKSKEEKLNNLTNILEIKLSNFIQLKISKLELTSKILESIDIQQILRRGFSIVSLESGKVLSSVKDLLENKKINIRMCDGKISTKNIEFEK